MSIIQRLNKRLHGCWCPFFSAFHVLDLQAQSETNGPSVVFVVESPHTSEVRSGERADLRFPLAGNSGKAVTSKFIHDALLCSRHADQPLGALARDGHLDWFRVVNVCQLPLQADTYHQLFASAELDLGAGLPSLQAWGELMVAFRRIRGYGENTSSGWPKDNLEREVLEDFRERLRCAVSDSPLVVAFGRVAKAACEKAAHRERELACISPPYDSGPSQGNESWDRMTPMATVPHPSFGQWSTNAGEVQQMLDIVKEHLGRVTPAT